MTCSTRSRGPRQDQRERTAAERTNPSALRDGLKDNNSEAELASLKGPVDQFADILKKIGTAKNGDTVSLDFTADGVGVSLNGEARGRVASAPFARALLKVWLGENPVDGSLKKALLGG